MPLSTRYQKNRNRVAPAFLNIQASISLVLTEIDVRCNARHRLESSEVFSGCFVLIGEITGEAVYGSLQTKLGGMVV